MIPSVFALVQDKACLPCNSSSIQSTLLVTEAIELKYLAKGYKSVKISGLSEDRTQDLGFNDTTP